MYHQIFFEIHWTQTEIFINYSCMSVVLFAYLLLLLLAKISLCFNIYISSSIFATGFPLASLIFCGLQYLLHSLVLTPEICSILHLQLEKHPSTGDFPDLFGLALQGTSDKQLYHENQKYLRTLDPRTTSMSKRSELNREYSSISVYCGSD